jgi:hypothetical protein
MDCDFVASLRSAVNRKAVVAALAVTVGLVVAQPAAADTSTVKAVADAYTSNADPTRNYGGLSTVRIDANPAQTGYLRFTPQFSGKVTKAALRVYTTTSSATGFGVYPVADSSWGERTITYGNAPAAGATRIAGVGSFSSYKWLSLDVTPAVTQSGPVTLALKTTSASGFAIAAREYPNPRTAELVVTTDTSGTPPAPAPEPTPVPPASTDAVRPYDPASPWNTPIAAGTPVDPLSGIWMNAIADNGLPLTSDVDQYAIAVYRFDASTPRRTVKLSGYYSTYDAGDNSRQGFGLAPTITGVPIPENARPSAGSDGQIVIWDPVSGTEYSFWQFARDAQGNYTATNGYRYHTTSGYFGRFADGLAGRGAGTPYFAGLVRKWEIDQGRIDHALAFAYRSPAPVFRFPASKSDGDGLAGVDPPEGARIQLDPTLTDADFTAWGLSPAAKTIARALQRYGMYIIDNSGSSKIYLEDRMTAGWGSDIGRSLPSRIPWSAFRVVAAPGP